MAAVVQATCPGCRAVLRIPAEWADRTMKCKKCGTVVQGRRKGAAPPPLAEPESVFDAPQPYYPPHQQMYPYAVPPASHPDSTSALPDPTETAAPNYRRKAKYKPNRNRWVGPVVVLVVLGGLVGTGISLSNYIQKQLPTAPMASASKEDAPGTTEGGKPGSALKTVGDPFPRRLLFIHVSNYVYFNHLSAGTVSGKDAPSRSAEKMAFELRVPTEKDNNQLVVLTDSTATKDFRPPLKPVVMAAYEQFFNTCRPQDRIVVYFGGHAVAANGKAYLVPVEGEPGEADTFIPLADFYDKLAACKAQQKLVLFDVCRLDPDRGEEKPGGEKMSEDLSKLLLAAPAGVRVAVSASAGENAQEASDSGSEFLTAFRVVAERSRRTGKQPAAKADDPIPASQWLDALTAYLSEPKGKTPTQRLRVGGADGTATVAYDKATPPAARVELPPAASGVSENQVVDMLRQVSMPGLRSDLAVPADLGRVYPFLPEAMAAYADDGVTEAMIEKEPEKYAVRKAALDTLRTINKVWQPGTADKGGLMEEFEGDVDDTIRKKIEDQGKLPAKINYELNEAIIALDAAAKKLKDEKSKRWRAIFQYARAQAMLRWAFMNEYGTALGKIRTDSLPRDAKGGRPTIKLVSVGKPTKSSKERADAAKELLDEMATEHKGTPYEVIAKLHKYISVGLEWRVAVAEKKIEEGK